MSSADEFRGPGGVAAPAWMRGPEKRGLTYDETIKVITLDPGDPMDAGTLRAMRTRISDRSAPELALFDWLALAPRRPGLGPIAPNPARIDPEGRKGEHRLTSADRAWLDRVDADRLTDEDVTRIAGWEADCVDESDRRLLALVIGPARRKCDAAEERARLRSEIADAEVIRWNLRPDAIASWRTIAADRLADERTAELAEQIAGLAPADQARLLASTDREARREAVAVVNATTTGLAAARSAAVARARARLVELDQGKAPASSAPAPRDLDDRAGDLGRLRAASVQADRTPPGGLNPTGQFVEL